MGSSKYNIEERKKRAEEKGYTRMSKADFPQNKLGCSHMSMRCDGLRFHREARDSANHPNTVPVQLYLDVTGSMGDIPVHMMREGLPTLISSCIAAGIPDIALMFGAIGDHEYDRYPLQVGQFESGDAELDMWLERVYIESGGGSNAGESYALAWYMASHFVSTDAWDKRKQKGFIFTIGDEPNLQKYSFSTLQRKIFGSNIKHNKSYSDTELYKMASEKNHIFHIYYDHHYHKDWIDYYRKLLKSSNVIVVTDYTEIPKEIVKAIVHTIKSDPAYINPVNYELIPKPF